MEKRDKIQISVDFFTLFFSPAQVLAPPVVFIPSCSSSLHPCLWNSSSQLLNSWKFLGIFVKYGFDLVFSVIPTRISGWVLLLKTPKLCKDDPKISGILLWKSFLFPDLSLSFHETAEFWERYFPN